jgi:hypothetical protein
MARCGCADTGAESVRSMLSAQDGVKYNSITGVFSADISPNVGNNLTLDGFGRLFVPTGSATVNVGPGILGDGSGGNPVRANVASWPYVTAPGTGAQGVFVDTITGQLLSPPIQVVDFVSTNFARNYANLPVAAGTTPVLADTFTVNLLNPDPNRSCVVIIEREVRMTYALPGTGTTGPSQAGMTIDGALTQIIYNNGATAMAVPSIQATRMFKSANLGPGGASTYGLQVGTRNGAGSSTYSAISVDIRVLYIGQ